MHHQATTLVKALHTCLLSFLFNHISFVIITPGFIIRHLIWNEDRHINDGQQTDDGADDQNPTESNVAPI